MRKANRNSGNLIKLTLLFLGSHWKLVNCSVPAGSASGMESSPASLPGTTLPALVQGYRHPAPRLADLWQLGDLQAMGRQLKWSGLDAGEGGQQRVVASWKELRCLVPCCPCYQKESKANLKETWLASLIPCPLPILQPLQVLLSCSPCHHWAACWLQPLGMSALSHQSCQMKSTPRC